VIGARGLGALPRSGRLYVAEAVAAEDIEAVRRIWADARAAGEPAWYLERIAAIGRRRPGARALGSAA
jgi:hypothetical protein